MSDGSEAGAMTGAKALSAGLVLMPDSICVCGETLVRAWKWLTQRSRGVLARGASRRLRVAETVSLGEKRFVSILQVDGEQFLLGGSPSNIVLLAKLDGDLRPSEARSFECVLSHVNRKSENDSDASAEEAR